MTPGRQHSLPFSEPEGLGYDSEVETTHPKSMLVSRRDTSLTAFKPTPDAQVHPLRRDSETIERHPLPPHWESPSTHTLLGKLESILFNTLCLIAFGHAGLHRVWVSIKLVEDGDESMWKERLQQTCDRLNNMLLVAGLLLATSAVFITTEPPKEAMLNYTLRGPYMCMLGSFGLLIGGIIVTSSIVLFSGRAKSSWSENVLYASRIHVYCTLLLFSYPFLSIGVASLLLAFGMLTAIWCAEDTGIQGAASIVLAMPIFVAALFGIACASSGAVASRDDTDGKA